MDYLGLGWGQQQSDSLQRYYDLQQYNPLQPAPTPATRLQAVLAAGAVRAACETIIQRKERAREECEAQLIAKIEPLPDVIKTETVYVGTWPLGAWRKVDERIIPTDAEQSAHKQASEAQAREWAQSWHRVPSTITTLHGLASHLPPSTPMPLEGEYLSAIAEHLEPFDATPTTGEK